LISTIPTIASERFRKVTLVGGIGMSVSYWRLILALCSLGLMVMPAMSGSQDNPDPKINDDFGQSRVPADHCEKKYAALKVTLFRPGGDRC
jgi:hypothetical protein